MTSNGLSLDAISRGNIAVPTICALLLPTVTANRGSWFRPAAAPEFLSADTAPLPLPAWFIHMHALHHDMADANGITSSKRHPTLGHHITGAPRDAWHLLPAVASDARLHAMPSMPCSGHACSRKRCSTSCWSCWSAREACQRTHTAYWSSCACADGTCSICKASMRSRILASCPAFLS